MSVKKSASKKPVKEKTVMYKIGSQIGQVTCDLIAGKDHLMEMAENALDSVKSTFKHIAVKEQIALKKTVKTTVKKAVVKPAGAALKKVATPAAAKKTVPKKQVAKKVARKVAAKK